MLKYNVHCNTGHAVFASEQIEVSSFIIYRLFLPWWTWVVFFSQRIVNKLYFYITEEEPFLIFANRFYVRKFSLESSDYERVSSEHSYTHVLDYDYEQVRTTASCSNRYFTMHRKGPRQPFFYFLGLQTFWVI